MITPESISDEAVGVSPPNEPALAAQLIGYACDNGLVRTEADLNLVERLALEAIARRQGYLDGQASFKEASVAVCRSADWPKVANQLESARHARSYRTLMLGPRLNDYPGLQSA